MEEFIQGPVADPHVVRELTTRLLNTFNDFMASFDGRVDYAEGFMAAHNFHVFVVENLVEATGNPIWRNAAATTFKHRLENPGQYDTEGK